jgi:hypothetical protein
MTFFRLLWLFPLAFLLHVIEEARGFPTWVADVLHGSISRSAFLVNNAVFMIVLVAACTYAARARSRLAVMLLLVWTSGQMFWNFVFHLYTDLHFDAYSPGLVSAVLLYYPLYLFLAARAHRERLVSSRMLAIAFVAGLPGMLVAIWGGLYGFGAVPCAHWIP